MIKGDFVPKDVKQFGHSSQDLNLEYKKDSMLLFSEQLILVVLVEKRMGK